MKMRFGMLSRVDQRNHVLDGVQIPMGRGNFEGERHAPTCPTTLLRELCKTAEPVEMPFELWTQVDQSKYY